jgi:hypothetical protein
MFVYLSHKYGGKKENFDRVTQIANRLQKEHPEHCFISPLHAFSFLKYNDIGYDEEIFLCEDLISLMSKDDVLLVCSDISEGVRREIALANLIGMRVEYLESDGL